MEQGERYVILNKSNACSRLDTNQQILTPRKSNKLNQRRDASVEEPYEVPHERMARDIQLGSSSTLSSTSSSSTFDSAISMDSQVIMILPLFNHDKNCRTGPQ